jgi:hypothetical protein
MLVLRPTAKQTAMRKSGQSQSSVITGWHGCQPVLHARSVPPHSLASHERKCLPDAPELTHSIKFNGGDQRAGRVDIPFVKPCKPGSVASHGSSAVCPGQDGADRIDQIRIGRS